MSSITGEESASALCDVSTVSPSTLHFLSSKNGIKYEEELSSSLRLVETLTNTLGHACLHRLGLFLNAPRCTTVKCAEPQQQVVLCHIYSTQANSLVAISTYVVQQLDEVVLLYNMGCRHNCSRPKTGVRVESSWT